MSPAPTERGPPQPCCGPASRQPDSRTHAYHSPHLVRFHERIIVAGRRIREGELSRLLNRCEQANQGRPITFFEITTAAAFLAFAETEADYCILEVGLGGRLDATNVMPRPEICAITRVGMGPPAVSRRNPCRDCGGEGGNSEARHSGCDRSAESGGTGSDRAHRAEARNGAPPRGRRVDLRDSRTGHGL